MGTISLLSDPKYFARTSYKQGDERDHIPSIRESRERTSLNISNWPVSLNAPPAQLNANQFHNRTEQVQDPTFYTATQQTHIHTPSSGSTSQELPQTRT